MKLDRQLSKYRFPLLKTWGILLICFALQASKVQADEYRRWEDVQTIGPFIVHANFSMDRVPKLATELSELQTEVSQKLEIQLAQEPIYVYLFAHEASYRDYMKRYFPGVPFRRALFIKNNGPGMVFAYRSPDFEVDLRHECTHALLHSVLPELPLWLDEGIAEYFEVGKQAEPIRKNYVASIKRDLNLGKVHNISELAAMTKLEQMGESEYRDCWAWVQFLLDGPRQQNRLLQRYLNQLALKKPVASVQRIALAEYQDLSRSFTNHFAR
ncbi:MAG: hypothetical protein COA78_03265 [Blastopirellula sp.]|nr:MAG: hypothetical protein COA78_03265 [Blastopirellula sp.]